MEGNNGGLGKLKAVIEAGKVVVPTLENGVEKMAELSKNLSVEDIKNTAMKGAASVRVGKTWEASAAPSTEVEVNLYEFKTGEAANSNFQGRFGGFADPHPKGVTASWTHFEEEAPAQSAKIKADSISEKAKTVNQKKQKSSPDSKKTKLTKAEKEIEARTHSDSMLGPVIPDAEVDNRTPEEKRLGDAWEKEAGEAVESEAIGVPATEGENDLQITPDIEGDIKKSHEHIKGLLKEGEYEIVKAEWREARDRSDKLEKEFNEKYEQFLQNESKGWRKIVNFPRRLLGLRPKMTGEIQALHRASEEARANYFEKAKQLKDIKEGGNYGGNYDIVARYQRLLAHKLVVGVHEKRTGIQEKIAIEAEQSSRIRPVLETMRKYRYVRWGATAVGYSVLAGVTGGVGAAALAGGAYGARIAGGMALGGFTGSGVRAIGKEFERRSLQKLEKAQGDVKGDFFKRGFTSSEAEVDSLTQELGQVKGRNKTAAATVAVGAGFIGGNLIDGELDSISENSKPSDVLNPKREPNEPFYPDQKDTDLDPRLSEDTTPKAPEVKPETELPQPEPKIIIPEPVPPAEPIPEVPPSSDVVPEARPDAAVPEVPPSAEGAKPAPTPEVVPELPEVKHTVVKGDNVWNIMEGKGPDANPVGGKSEVLNGMSLAERQDALDKLIDYAEKNPEFAKEVGAVKSDGDIHRIYPGEEINVTLLDEKLRELLGIEANNTEEAVTETADGTPLEEAEAHEPEDLATDINQLTLQEVEDLAKNTAMMNPEATARLEALGMDAKSLEDLMRSLDRRVGEFDMNMTVGEYMKNSEYVTRQEYEGYSRTPEDQPYGNYKPIDDGPAEVQEASVEAAEAPAQSMSNYIRSIEQPRNGLLDSLFGLGKPNIAGTFDQLKDLNVGEIKEMVASNSLPEGVSEDGFDRWVGEMNKVAANDNERFGDVISRGVNSRVA